MPQNTKDFNYLPTLEDKLRQYRTGKIDHVTRLSWDSNYKTLLKKAFMISAKGQRVLDVGCGTGAYIIPLAKKGRQCYGIDPLLPLSIAKAHVLAKREKAQILLCQATGEFLPFKNETFDLVLCLSTLQHVADQKSTLRQIRQTLKNNGKLLISIATTKNIHTLFREVTPKHFTARFDVATTKKLLEREKFQILETTASGFFPPLLNKALQAIYAAFGEKTTRGVIETLDKVANMWLRSAGNLIILCNKPPSDLQK